MKYITKLSSKLLVGLGIIIVGIIVFQVVVSKRVIADMEKIKQVQSIEQMHKLLENKELNTYQSISCSPFSSITICDVDVVILKGDKYEVYASNYCKEYVEIESSGNKLIINSLDWEAIGSDKIPVFIFMPEDPQSISFAKPKKKLHPPHFTCKVYGFDGRNTIVSVLDGQCRRALYTDMPYVNIKQRDSWLELYTSSLNSTARIPQVQIDVNAEISRFDLDDQISDTMNVDIQLQGGTIGNVKINPNSKVGTLSLKGSVYRKFGYADNDMYVKYSGQCDSLIIQLTGKEGVMRKLFLSKDLSAKYENIDCSENIGVNYSK